MKQQEVVIRTEKY